MRLFVAIELPDKIKSLVEEICFGVPGARWLTAEQLHLTLRFIGEVDGDTFLDIKEILAEIQFQKLQLQLKGVGCFPPSKQPKILWAGLAANDELMKFQRKIETVLVREAGLDPEGRNYTPHITLARLKKTPDHRVGNYLEEFGLFSTPEFSVTSFSLVSSILTNKGAKHTIEDEF